MGRMENYPYVRVSYDSLKELAKLKPKELQTTIRAFKHYIEKAREIELSEEPELEYFSNEDVRDAYNGLIEFANKGLKTARNNVHGSWKAVEIREEKKLVSEPETVVNQQNSVTNREQNVQRIVEQKQTTNIEPDESTQRVIEAIQRKCINPLSEDDIKFICSIVNEHGEQFMMEILHDATRPISSVKSFFPTCIQNKLNEQKPQEHKKSTISSNMQQFAKKDRSSFHQRDYHDNDDDMDAMMYGRDGRTGEVIR